MNIQDFFFFLNPSILRNQQLANWCLFSSFIIHFGSKKMPSSAIPSPWKGQAKWIGMHLQEKNWSQNACRGASSVKKSGTTHACDKMFAANP